MLRSHLVQTLNGDDEFRERHASVVNPVPVMLNSDQATIDRGALWEGYRHHLTQLGLLEERLQVDRKTKQPVFEPAQGRYGVAGHELSSLGRLLLRMIGLSTDGFDTTDRVSAL